MKCIHFYGAANKGRGRRGKAPGSFVCLSPVHVLSCLSAWSGVKSTIKDGLHKHLGQKESSGIVVIPLHLAVAGA